MTKEEKQLLFQDLCARLPYGVVCMVETSGWERDFTLEPLNVTYLFNVGRGMWLDCKPYLRPMSSMTEEEKKEFTKVLVKSQDCSYENNESATTIVNDWYLSKGFDVRGLIPKGLALEAKEGMYK